MLLTSRFVPSSRHVQSQKRNIRAGVLLESRKGWERFLIQYKQKGVSRTWRDFVTTLCKELPPKDAAVVSQNAELVVEQLSNRGWAVVPKLLDELETRELRKALQELWTKHERNDLHFEKGDLEEGYDVDQRSDYVLWLDDIPEESSAASSAGLQSCLLRQHSLLGVVSNAFGCRIEDLNGHFALYPAGGRFVFHVDEFPPGHESRVSGEPHRRVSLVTYLNEADWQTSDGGCLRMFHYDKDGREGSTDILPLGGTCVVFWSEVCFHEVLPAARTRYSLTTWGTT